MADWLIHLLIQIGGVGAVFAILKVLLKPIWTTLNNYTTAYANGQAAIDVRIRNIEKLAEEQARLTRTVESIKDEIAAQAKSRDNRWAFRKEIYCGLITSIEQSLSQSVSACYDVQPLSPEAKEKLVNAIAKFSIAASLAPLAASKSLLPLIKSTLDELTTNTNPAKPFGSMTYGRFQQVFLDLREKVQGAGRNDLWPDSEPKAEAIGGERGSENYPSSGQ
jgi:hypothetical protein